MKLERLSSYIKDYGIRSSAVLFADRLLGRKASELDYGQWQRRHALSPVNERSKARGKLSYQPVIGVKASMPGQGREAFYHSLDAQIYHRFHALKNTSSMNQGAEYLLMVEGAAVLGRDLLWECAAYLMQSRAQKVDLIYFDSDRLNQDGTYDQPAFRPEYDPDLLERVNYMGQVVLVRTQAALQAGLPKAGKAAFHAFLKRLCAASAGEMSGGNVPVRHIPKVLYHTPESGDPVQNAEITSCVSDYIPERHIPRVPGRSTGKADGSRESRAEELNCVQAAGKSRAEELNRVQTSGKDHATDLISVLIPGKDHAADLSRCVKSLLTVNTWQNLEILILDNQSGSKETFDLYDQLKAQDPRIRILEWDHPFNYSAINNYGAAMAKGEYLLLLNNDTEVMEPESIALMHRLVSIPSVGAAGALLLYPDRSVQHAGIILGHGGIAGHAWEKLKPEEAKQRFHETPFQEMVFTHTHNVSAVTGACLMVRKSVWQQAGGMDEALAVTFNDVDLCMRIRKNAHRILMCPGACLLHYESASRGSEDTPQKVSRFHEEIRIFVHRWEEELEAGDPFYNPNLTLTGKSWTLKDDIREKRKPYLKYLRICS